MSIFVFDPATQAISINRKKVKRIKTEIIIPEKIRDKKIKQIEQSGFAEIDSVIRIELPEGIEEIQDKAFDTCKSLEEIQIPDSVKVIGEWAFGWCKQLKSIKLPNGLKEIPKWAFVYCESLEEVQIPDSVIMIRDRVFEGCKSLREINVPDSVESIAEAMFRDCKQLRRVKLPKGIRVIPDEAFRNCESLEEVQIPDSVIRICSRAFEGCKSLREMDIPDSVKSIGDKTFLDCKQLRGIKLPEGIEVIGEDAFEECAFLEKHKIPDSVKVVGEQAQQKNMGTHYRDEAQAHANWTAQYITTYTPVLICRFQTLKQARKAIASTSFIHESGGDLISSETIDYGCYINSDQKGEVIICGHGFSTEMFNEAKQKLINAGGEIYKEQEPKKKEEKESQLKKSTAPIAEEVLFIKNTKKELVPGVVATYENYSAPSEAVAKEFLATKSVSQPLYYIVVDTPQGSWGKDSDGIYKE